MGGKCLLINFSRGTNCRDLTHRSNLSIARVINHIHRLSLSICAAKAGILRSLHSSTMTLRLWNALRRRRCPCTCAMDTSGPGVLREPISNEGICRREVCLISWFRMTSIERSAAKRGETFSYSMFDITEGECSIFGKLIARTSYHA